MTNSVDLYSDDPIINSLKFRKYYNEVKRCFKRFLPLPGEPETMKIPTSWGENLTATPGDYLVGPIDAPDDYWPVDAEIFEKTYEITGPGICIKTAITELVPLVDVTEGEVDRMVTVHTLEGPVTVRAGDYYLARGVNGEIWTYPKDMVQSEMKPAE